MFDGKKIREKRRSLGLSAEALADILNVEPGNIYKWEKGHRPRNPEELMKVEKWLGSTSNGEDYEKKYIALLERTNAIWEFACS